MKLGAHMSIAGGCHNALLRAEELGCTAVQVFTKNASQWAGKALTLEDVQLFKATRDQKLYKAEDLIAHDSYLINLASPDDALWEKSLNAFGDELDRCDMLGIPALVTHAGAHMGSGEETGLERIAQALNRVLGERRGQDVTVLLETTAGQGTCLCYSFEHFPRIFSRLEDGVKDQVAVCWDTCHLLASGQDFSDEAKYHAMVDEFDRLVGLNKLKAIHLNDSKKGLGSRVDRHEHIGQGVLGLEPFRLILNDERFTDLPKVIETPKGPDLTEDKMNLELLRSLIRNGA